MDEFSVKTRPVVLSDLIPNMTILLYYDYRKDVNVNASFL